MMPPHFTPMDILDYTYAVLHSPRYRERYAEFLKTDFPRIPYPDNADVFWRLVAIGREIRLYHLLEHPALANPAVIFPNAGDNTIAETFTPAKAYGDGTVRINSAQYFAGVPESAWNFWIGGYQPAQKWLKDRRGQVLTFDAIGHYRRLVTALAATHALMPRVDEECAQQFTGTS